MSSGMLNEYFQYNKKSIKKYGINSVVLMMVGSFYEIYGKKQEFEYMSRISNILSIQLTRKNKSKEVSDSNPYTCGFPCYAISKHLSKLLNANFTVCIYDQFDKEQQKEKERKLVNIYSPSTYIEEEIITNNWLCLIRIDTFFCPIQKKKMLSGYLSTIDLSTGKNKLFECYDNKDTLNNVEMEIKRILYSVDPCEIVLICDNEKYKKMICKEFDRKMIHTDVKIDKKFSNPNYQTSFLEKIFGKSKIGQRIESLGLHRSGELLSSYIHLLQFAYEHDNNIVRKINFPELMNSKDELYINNDCLFQLNLISNNVKNYNTKIGSLFDVINFTSTKMGNRLLKDKILRPITSAEKLNVIYDKVEKIISDTDVYRYVLRNIADLEKKNRKMILKKLNPYEFSALDTSFNSIVNLFEIENVENFVNDDLNYQQLKNRFLSFYEDYKNTFDIEILGRYDLSNIKMSFFKEGINSSIDELNSRIKNIYKIFSKISEKLYVFGNSKARVKLNSNEKDGYYFTTTKRCWNEIFQNKKESFHVEYKGANRPLLFKLEDIIVNQNKNNVKITSKLINKLSQTLVNNTNKIKSIAKKCYLKKLTEYQNKWGECFQNIISFVSNLDVIVSYGHASKKYGYCRPIIKNNSKRSYINVKNIRHPIIERIQDDVEYVTNDVEIGNSKCGILLYGLNSSGKSSLLRSIGCNIILAQMGMFTSASSFEYYPFQNLLTKISNNDNLFKGQSTFIVEMYELKNILKKSNRNSMILCDELTSGTETASSTGLVTSSIIHLIKKNTNFLFTTHLHELKRFKEITENSDLDVYHFDIDVDPMDGVKYNRKLQKGFGKEKYGIEIAQAIGLDKEFIKSAFNFRNKHEGNNSELLNYKKSRYNSKVFVDKCNRCGRKHDLHTHHIHEQHTSNKNGIINHFPKNIRHNLEILCEECHIKHHK